MIDATSPNARPTSGKSIRPTTCAGLNTPGLASARPEPRIMAPIFSAAVDSNRSAPRPAQSPTLSPTRSAITAGVRGGSSPVPPPPLPPPAAPAPAALVRIPPPPPAHQGPHQEAQPHAPDL